MKELCEFRVQEHLAHLVFDDHEGCKREGGVRVVELTTDDPRFRKVGRVSEELKRTVGQHLFHGWQIRRRYTERERRAAQLFRLIIKAVFGPAGEECGTQ